MTISAEANRHRRSRQGVDGIGRGDVGAGVGVADADDHGRRNGATSISGDGGGESTVTATLEAFVGRRLFRRVGVKGGLTLGARARLWRLHALPRPGDDRVLSSEVLLDDAKERRLTMGLHGKRERQDRSWRWRLHRHADRRQAPAVRLVRRAHLPGPPADRHRARRRRYLRHPAQPVPRALVAPALYMAREGQRSRATRRARRSRRSRSRPT